MGMRAMKATGLFCLVVFLASTFAMPQATGDVLPEFCQNLKPVDGTYGYQPRQSGMRCEGLYASDIGSKFELVSFLIGDLAYDLSPNGTILIRTPRIAGFSSDTVYVRALALPPGTYYQMDTVMPTTGRMDWPMRDVLWPSRLKHFYIGLFAWTGKGNNKTYIPLMACDKSLAPNNKPSKIEMRLRTPLDLEAVSWKAPDLKGHSNWKSLESDFPVYAGRCISIPLPKGPTLKVNLKIAAKPVGSSEWIHFELNVIRPQL